MPIHYICVACREESFLPDSKAGTLQGCPRCRLKFLAPAPNVQVVPVPGAAAPGATRPQPTATPQPPPPRPAPLPASPSASAGSSRPNFGGNLPAAGARPPGPGSGSLPVRPASTPSAASLKPAPAATAPTAPAATAPPPPPRPVAPPPNYPRDAAKPPLYPLDGDDKSQAAAPGAKLKADGPPPKKSTTDASHMFGVTSGEIPIPSLFGSDEDAAEEPGELFADAIPSAPESDLDEELDVPIAPRKSEVAAIPGALVDSDIDDDESASANDEGGGVAVPEDSDAVQALHTQPTAVHRRDSELAPTAILGQEASSDETIPIDADASGLDALISMDDLFGKPKGGAAAPTATPARPAPRPAAPPPPLGAHGVLPAPFLKPAPAPAAAEPPAGAAIRPFTLTAVEGIADGPFHLTGGEVYLLGRDKDAQVKILSTSVSRRHARIDGTGHDHILIDLGSANGTQVNGQSVARHPLKDGDIIRMGKVLLRYAAH